MKVVMTYWEKEAGKERTGTQGQMGAELTGFTPSVGM